MNDEKNAEYHLAKGLMLAFISGLINFEMVKWVLKSVSRAKSNKRDKIMKQRGGFKKAFLYNYKGYELSKKEIAERLGISEYKVQKLINISIPGEDISEINKRRLENAKNKEALGDCTLAQLEIINNPKMKNKDFGLSGFYALAKQLKGNGYIGYIPKDAIGFIYKYYMTPNEFNYLREELSVELNKDFLKEKRILIFSIHGINFEVEKVSIAIGKKIRDQSA